MSEIPVRLTVGDIVKAVSEVFSVSEANILGRKRTQAYCVARVIAVGLTRALLGMSLSDMGKHFDNRDPATIICMLLSVVKSPNSHCTEVKKILARLDVNQTVKDLFTEEFLSMRHLNLQHFSLRDLLDGKI